MRIHSFRAMRLAAILAALPLTAIGQPSDPGAALLTRAAASYYSLNRLGFTGARCAMTPDWAVVLGRPRSDPATQPAFAIFDALKFNLALDAQGNAHIDKRDTGSGRSATQATGIQQIFNGLDQEMTGFFTTWALFSITPVTPPPTQAGVTVTERPGGYRISYRDGEASVVIDTDRAGQATHLSVTSPTFTSTIDPTFTRTSEGLVLTHYVAEYMPVSGPGRTHLVVDIDYQQVNAIRIPSTIKVDTIYDGSPAKVNQTLTDCQVTRKSPGK